jgi:predicted Na+-dependent transporter
MHFVLTVVMPSVATFMLAVVGLELTVRDFQRIATFPSLIALTLAVQLVVLP